MSNLVDESPAVNVVVDKNLNQKLWLATCRYVPSLLFEHRTVVGDRDKLIITEPLRVGKVGIPSLITELPNDQPWLIQP